MTEDHGVVGSTPTTPILFFLQNFYKQQYALSNMKKGVKKRSNSNYKKEHLGLSALTLAITGFFVTLFNPFASIVIFIVSLVFSIIQQKKNPTKQGKVALILSIIGLVLDVIFIFLLVTVIANLIAQVA